jgi:biofilm PGA synthesis N-glycosyltransferase PgaC
VTDKYVLITAARNEQDYIERTIKSVIYQTILPLKWIIVSDSSTDNTDDIVRSYMKKYDFIELLTRNGDSNRNFGSKAKSVMYGYDHIRNCKFDFLGNLDADISFSPDYYENMLRIFASDPRLGLIGGTRYDLSPKGFMRVQCAEDSVGGPFQFFRRECFEEIEGYKPLKYGGIDAVAETTARMYGWKVKSISDNLILHFRTTGSANKNIFTKRFKDGIKNYKIGFHPLHFLLKYTTRTIAKPLILGNLILISGYFWAAVCRYEKDVSNEFVQYLRSEQIGKLKSGFSKKIFTHTRNLVFR